MSMSLDQIEIQQFISDAHAEFQSQGFLLEPSVRVKQGTRGEIINFPVFGKGVANQKGVQDDVTPLDINSRNVTLTMQDWFAAEYVDRTFKYKLAVNATQEYSSLCAQAIGRRSDQMIIDAIISANYGGGIEQGNTVTVSGNATYEQFLEGHRYLRQNAAAKGDLFCIMDADAEANLLADDHFTNIFFMKTQTLAGNGLDGQEILGIRIIVLPNMPEGGLPDGTFYMYNRQAVGYAANARLEGTIDWVPTKASYLIDMWLEANACVIDQTGMVKLVYTPN